MWRLVIGIERWLRQRVALRLKLHHTKCDDDRWVAPFDDVAVTVPTAVGAEQSGLMVSLARKFLGTLQPRKGEGGDVMGHASRKLFRKFALVLMSCFPGTALLAQSITVVSFGGSYARASQEAYHKPFTEETGIEVRLEDYNGGLAQIRAQVDAGSVYWDVVDLNLDDAILGCDEGLFELMNPSDLAPGVDAR